MTKLFGSLAAILIALAGYIAYKNYGTLGEKNAALDTAKQTLQTNEAKLKAAKEKLAALPDQVSALEAEVAKMAADEVAAIKANEELKAKVQPAIDKIAADKAALVELKEKSSKIGDLNELATKMRLAKTELEELNQSISTAEAKLANITSQTAAAAADAARAKADFDGLSTGKSFATLKTRIRSVYPNWGFVTLASGNNAGVVADSTLDVIQGGEVVAKLLVTAVESTTSSASIVPDSVKEGTKLSSGDLVVPGIMSAKPAGN